MILLQDAHGVKFSLFIALFLRALQVRDKRFAEVSILQLRFSLSLAALPPHILCCNIMFRVIGCKSKQNKYCNLFPTYFNDLHCGWWISIVYFIFLFFSNRVKDRDIFFGDIQSKCLLLSSEGRCNQLKSEKNERTQKIICSRI